MMVVMSFWKYVIKLRTKSEADRLRVSLSKKHVVDQVTIFSHGELFNLLIT